MPPVKTKDGILKREPYPLNQFPPDVIQSIAKRIVHLKAIGQSDISGNQFNRIFCDSINGKPLTQPFGIVDASWNECGWSVKTVLNNKPFTETRLRLISGRNSPKYSSGITDPLHDIQATGRSVLEIYNHRINTASSRHKDIRMLAFLRNMKTNQFTLFERPISPFPTNNYIWRSNEVLHR